MPIGMRSWHAALLRLTGPLALSACFLTQEGRQQSQTFTPPQAQAQDVLAAEGRRQVSLEAIQDGQRLTDALMRLGRTVRAIRTPSASGPSASSRG